MFAETQEHTGQEGMTHQKRAPTPDRKKQGGRVGHNKRDAYGLCHTGERGASHRAHTTNGPLNSGS